MRVESLGPRTLLLGTVAGWAVLVAILALAGLGGRITPLADDPGSAPRLPTLPKAAPERLGPLAQYSELTARPPFYEGRRPQPFYLTNEAEAQAPSFDYVLTSVLITPGFRMAILQPSQGGEGVRVKQGEAASAAPQWTLVDLQPRAAVFEGPEGRRTLELRVFDGAGGQPPSVSMTGPPVAAPQPTGGSAPPQPAPQPGPTAGPVAPVKPATEPAEQPAMTTEQQMEAIRKRIEARRAQMRQQQGQAVPPPAPPPNPNQ